MVETEYNSTSDKYYIKNKDLDNRFQWQSFRDYFSYSDNFSVFKNNDKLIYKFYNEIRCGLLHQSESKFNSLINIKNNEMIIINKTQDDEINNLIINRNLFHNAVKADFYSYVERLKNPNSTNLFGENLRENCHKKMTFICN